MKKKTRQDDRFTQLLRGYKIQTMDNLYSKLNSNGVQLSVLGKTMVSFRRSLPELPKGVACCSGCAYCCHLKVGVSIPEALVIFDVLKSMLTVRQLKIVKQRIIRISKKGDTLSDVFWQANRTACPFLDSEGKNICSIYEIRPISCRAYHSTDQAICKKGFEMGRHLQIPCFPLYRASVDMYTKVLIEVMGQKELFSYQVGFVRALQILFENDTATDQWLVGNDVFITAKLSGHYNYGC